MTNRELDDLLKKELPGYSSVFLPSQDSASPTLQAFSAFGWKEGKFIGWPDLQWHKPRLYLFFQDRQQPFCFQRSTGEKIIPQEMNTDAGSIPRVVWSIPGLSPWDYLPAYIIHDWDFKAHHCGLSNRTFEEANLTLAEGIYTLMKSGVAESDWLRIEIIYRAVSTPIGRNLWDQSGCELPPTKPAIKSATRRSK